MQLFKIFRRQAKNHYSVLFASLYALFATLTTEFNFRFRRQRIRKKIAEASRLPQQLHIEGTNICNATCVFCAYPKMERPKEVMDMRLFEQTIDEYRSIGGKRISLTPIVGDPFVDPHLFQRLDYLDQCSDLTGFYFYTNAILMKPQASENLMKYGDKLSVYISLGGFDRETYKIIMGVDKFERVCQNIEAFVEIKRRTNSQIRLVIAPRCPPSKWGGRIWENFLEHQKEKLLVILDAIYYDSWAGKIKAEELRSVGLIPSPEPHRRGECHMLYAKPVVLANGLVNACACRDVEAELIIGNVREAPLKEIWEGENLKKIIALHKKGDYPDVCRRCTFYLSVYDPRSTNWLKIPD